MFGVLFSLETVKSIHKQQTTRRKPIECAPEANCGGREASAGGEDRTGASGSEGDPHLEVIVKSADIPALGEQVGEEKWADITLD